MQGAPSPAALLESTDDAVAKEWGSGEGAEILMKPLQRSNPTSAPELLMSPVVKSERFLFPMQGGLPFIHLCFQGLGLLCLISAYCKRT